VTLRYRPRTVTNEPTLLVVTKARALPETSLSRASENDTVLRVAGEPAVHSPNAGGAADLVSLRWRCDGYEYSVLGRANRTTVVTMAERIGCRAG
jgi:hypothetical protein